MKAVILLFVLSLSAVAQNASVIALSDADAATAKKLYINKVKAETAWADFQDRLNKQSGQALEFTPDFKLAVPLPQAALTTPGLSGIITSTPTWTDIYTGPPCFAESGCPAKLPISRW